MLMHETPLDTPRPCPYHHRPARLLTAALLRGASRLLDRLAATLTRDSDALSREAVVEFHAEAGAPEGALYVDGRLVGHVMGVKRL